MNTFLIVLFIIILLIIILLFLYMYMYNKINDTIIRINEAENRIDTNLRDKYDILTKSSITIKKELDVDDKTFSELNKLKARKLSNFEFDRILTKIYHEFLAIYENNNKITDNNEIYKYNKQTELIDEELVTLRAYYNANITKYNKLIKRFPTLIIAKIKKYQEKLFYDLKDMSDDYYEDFKI